MDKMSLKWTELFPQIYKELISTQLIRLKGKRKTSVKLGGILNKCLCDKRRELRWIPWHFHLSPSKGFDFNSSSALIPVSRLDGTNKRWKDHTNRALWNNKEETKRYRGVPRVGGGGWRLPLACIPESGGWKEETGLLAGVGGGLSASPAPYHRQIPALRDGLLIKRKQIPCRESSVDIAEWLWSEAAQWGSWHLCLLVTWPWASLLTSLCFSPSVLKSHQPPRIALTIMS